MTRSGSTCIVSWLYSTVSKEIWNDVNRPRATAYSAWTAITSQFLDNSLQRAVYAQQEFHSLFQGDMNISEYCGRLKRLADTIYDCGAAVSDPALVINTLRGLNNKFSQAIAVLSTMSPPPTFLYTKSYLLQEEHRMRHSQHMEAQTALMAAATTSPANKPVARPRLNHRHPPLVPMIVARSARRRMAATARTPPAARAPPPVPSPRRTQARHHRRGVRPTTRGRALCRRGP